MERGSRRGRDDDAPSRGFKYRERDPEAARRRAERTGMGDPYLHEDVKMFKPAEGDSTIRILPPTWDDAEHYGIEVWVHYDVGADGGTYLCLDKMKGKPCPVCEERKRANSEGDQEYADKLAPQKRVIMYMLDREKEKEGVKAWNIGHRMDQDIARLAVDKKTQEVLMVDHPTKGYDFSFTRTGQGMKTRYTGFQFARRASELDNDAALEFVEEHPLPDMLIFYSYDHIKKAFAGASSSKDKDSDDDDPKPRKSKARDEDDDSPRSRRSRDEEEDRPARGRRKQPELDMTWDEVHELTFRKLSQLVEDLELDIDPEASRDDDELADQICEACGIEKKGKSRARDDDDEPKPRKTSRTKVDDDEDKDDDRRGKLRRFKED